jgi:hypothetical protein
VHAEDVVEMSVAPAFVPAVHGGGADARQLGLLVAPMDRLASEGCFADGWTAPRAVFELTDWTSGSFELELSNATPVAREVRLTSALGEARQELGPQATRVVRVAVEPADRVTLEVSPPFVPSRHGMGADSRELGLLVLGTPGGG